ncbi:uncharacterized protein BDZ99DRAFT_523821 [Mytilinidion resinicola]|uniref:JmjC domain-containing protein n=1 Tax=Mytilinidion resinicola TaxID=574789 RepID=A0A6A6YCP4_9PEZI|nr:uncharacterized protein BDZ99DRAFT_523821 [Mytilinidion resinicola]KAF2806369.1 hypothetical protein BDZ99DRAFT_523821 [Mytilinidion resinicola]
MPPKRRRTGKPGTLIVRLPDSLSSGPEPLEYLISNLPKERGLESLQDIIDALPNESFSATIAATLRDGDFLSYVEFQKSPERQAVFGTKFLDQPRLTRYYPWTKGMPRDNVSAYTQNVVLADVITTANKLKDDFQNLHLNLHVAGADATTLLTAEVLRGMSKPLRPTPAVLMNIPSPRLHDLYSTPPIFATEKGVLRRTEVTVNIGPYLSFVDLHHDDAHGTQTLTSGRKLWLFFPPTETNLSALCTAYQASFHNTKGSSRGAQGERYLAALSGIYPADNAIQRASTDSPKLSNGIAVIQTANTNMWIPPFCPHAVFTLQSSVLVGREFYLPRTLPLRIEQVELFGAYEKCVSETGRPQVDWVVELVEHIAAVLRLPMKKKKKKMTGTTKKAPKRKRNDDDAGTQGNTNSNVSTSSSLPPPATAQSTRSELEVIFLCWFSQYEKIEKLVQNISSMPGVGKEDRQKMSKAVTSVWREFLRHPEVQAWRACPACGADFRKQNRREHLWKNHLLPCHSEEGWKFWGWFGKVQ